MDTMVLRTQQWLNETYNGRTGYVSVSETGNTGWNTIYALRRALQIELGITATSSNFGPSTTARFEERFPNGVHQQSVDDETEDNIYGIIQGALWCKGYSTNASYITTHFYSGTGNGIKSMKTDAGMIDPDSTVTLNVMKALLSMDYFVCSSYNGGDEKIRAMQQYLNRNYEDYIGIGPCDGVYGRDTNVNVIYALQAEEGLSTSIANGNFGPSTKKYCPTIPYDNVATNAQGNKYSNEDIKRFIKIIQMALYANGFGDGVLSDTYNSEPVVEFQKFCMLESSGVVDFSTWASLLISYGDEDRKGTACDTSTPLTDSHIQLLKKNGFQIVGRYLAHGSKGLKDDEVERILKGGLKLFLIYQAYAREVGDFTLKNARRDAYNAVILAQQRKIPADTVIYFAVDYDATDYEITNYIIPYLSEVRGIVLNADFKFGVYGSRNLCRRAMNELYSVSSFVGDLSSGYSGNKGFKLPENWNYDQIKNKTISDSEYGSLEIDVDIYRGQTQPVDHLSEHNDKEKVYTQLKALFGCAYSDFANQDVLKANRMVLEFIRYGSYSSDKFNLIAGDTEENKDYIDYIKTYFQSIIPDNMTFKDFYDGAVTGGIPINLKHWALTAEAQLHFTSSIIEAKDYSGWAGDLAQLGAEIQKVYDNPNNKMYKHIYTDDEIYQLIGCNSDSVAKSLGFENREMTGFSAEDLFQDIDAVNIATQLRTTPIWYAFYNYYIKENTYLHRASLFYDNLDKDGYEGDTTYQTLYNIASIYANKPPIFAQIFAGMFGDYDANLWANKLAKSFAKRINTMINNET